MSDQNGQDRNDKQPTTRHALGEGLRPTALLAFQCDIPLLLSGRSGIGKSQFLRTLAQSLGWSVIVLNLSLYESAAELLGLPVIDGDRTRYATPAILPTDGKGLLIIEEAARSAPHVMAPLYEFLTSRCIGEYQLPPGWRIAACMNPPGPDYDGHPFDHALRDRFLHVDVVADAAEWLRWAAANGVHPAITEVVRADARVFALASPRTWARASALLQRALASHWPPAEVERLLATQLRSVEAAHAVMRYLGGFDEDETIAPAEVLLHYARDSRLPRTLRAWLQQGRTDAVEKLVFGVETLLAGDSLVRLVATGGFDLESLERFAADVPGDRGRALLARFGDNPASGAALSVEAPQALLGYRKSSLFRQVARWLEGGLVHRLRALVHKVVDHLERLHLAGRAELLNRAPSVRVNLGILCRHLGDHGAPLRRELQRLGLEVEVPAEVE